MSLKYLRFIAMLALGGAAISTAGVVPAQSADTPIRKQIFSFPDPGLVVSPVPGLAIDSAGALYGAAVWGGPQNSGGLYKLTPPAAGQTTWTQTVLQAFSGGSSGALPQPPILDTNGAIYGALYLGGPTQKGQIYRATPPAAPGGAWTTTVLYSFGGAADGEGPSGRLVFDSSGALYGVTRFGGVNKAGVVYRLKPDATRSSWTYEKLWDLETPDGKGGSAMASDPVFDRAGALNIGMAATRTGAGAVIRLARPAAGTTAWTRQFLYRFTGATDGAQPGPVVLGLDGAVFGMTKTGGAGFGQVFRIQPPQPGQTAWTKSALHDFQGGDDGGWPAGGLLLDTGGALYGATSRMTTSGKGVVFRLSPPVSVGGAWSKTSLATFTRGDADGLDSLTFDAGGYLNLAATNGGAAGRGAVYTVMIPPYGIANTTKTTLYSFTGGLPGAVPDQTPVFGPDGALYGTTQQGGGGGNGVPECGMAYRLAPPAAGETAWTKTDLAYFSPRPWPCVPLSSMTFGDNGVLYGYSVIGGTYSQGTFFKLTPTDNYWNISTLFKFAGGSTGSWPTSRPLLDASGAVFGIADGGASGKGLLFKLTPGSPWTQAVIHNFGGAGDGAYPTGDLIFDTFGAIYGLTMGGGSADKGTVYRLVPPPGGSGVWTSEILFSFSGPDGWEPRGRLAFDVHGSLLGVTRIGGAYNQGLVYKLTPPGPGQTRWTQTVLYNFRGNIDGANPEAGVIIGRNRFLYGTTTTGGGAGCGTAYRLVPPDATNPQWRRLLLHSFTCGADGKYPSPALVSATHGELYGVTLFGGANDKGEIFRLD